MHRHRKRDDEDVKLGSITATLRNSARACARTHTHSHTRSHTCTQTHVHTREHAHNITGTLDARAHTQTPHTHTLQYKNPGKLMGGKVRGDGYTSKSGSVRPVRACVIRYKCSCAYSVLFRNSDPACHILLRAAISKVGSECRDGLRNGG